MGMSDEEPSKKMDEIRKFSAIYGRFDCKRKPEKPLTLHEVSFQLPSNYSSFMIVMLQFVLKKVAIRNVILQVSVNEAAAQICRLAPAMLTRRDELFPLARQVTYLHYITVCIVTIITFASTTKSNKDYFMKVKAIHFDLLQKLLYSHWDLFRLYGTPGISTARDTHGRKAFPLGNNISSIALFSLLPSR